MKRRLHASVAVLLALGPIVMAGCTSAAKASGNYVILSGKAADALFAQCSRGMPPRGDGVWQPGPRNIAKLEATLPAALAKEAAARREQLGGAPKGWLRQYTGTTRNGRHYIYGNFFPKEAAGSNDDHWRTAATIVCDGGAAFFGVEYEVETGTFTNLAFNGFG